MILRVGLLCLALCLPPYVALAQPAPDTASSAAEDCPLTTPRFEAHLDTPEVTGRVGEPVLLTLSLTPPEIPMGFFVTSLADVVEGPAGAAGPSAGELRMKILTGFPSIRLTAAVPGDYRLHVRVHLVAKSSCGGVKAAPLFDGFAVVTIHP